MSSIIEINNISFSYTSKQPVLENISFDIDKGEFLAVTGPNGAGKSTLLNLICGSLKSHKGKIKIDGVTVESYSAKKLAKKISVVRQEISATFGFSVLETVLMARTIYYNQVGFESESDRKIVQESLEATDTAQFAGRRLDSLSGGERRRVFIARALAQDCPIILLDEPTNFLDMKHQVGIYDLLKKIQLEKEKTIIAVTHDVNLAAQYCDQTLLLSSDGSYYFGLTEDILTSEQISRTFEVEISSATEKIEQFFIPLGKYSKYAPKSEDGPND